MFRICLPARVVMKEVFMWVSWLGLARGQVSQVYLCLGRSVGDLQDGIFVKQGKQEVYR